MDPLSVIETESAALAEALTQVAPSAPAPTCGEWTAADLLWHFTEVHLFWAGVLGRDVRSKEGLAEVEAAKPERPATVTEMLPLRAAATADLVDQLRVLPDAEPRWSWWPSDQSVGFTRRMQVCEAAMHRVDAQVCAGVPIEPFAAGVSAALINQCADVMWGWQPEGSHYEPLTVARLAATDTGRSWHLEVGHGTGVESESGEPYAWPTATRVEKTRSPAVTVTGSEQDLARWAWHRPTEDPIRVDGDSDGAVARLVEWGIG